MFQRTPFVASSSDAVQHPALEAEIRAPIAANPANSHVCFTRARIGGGKIELVEPLASIKDRVMTADVSVHLEANSAGSLG